MNENNNNNNNPLKIKQPILELVIPSTKVRVSCRPWLVKEERILLSAKESNKAEDIALAVQQVVRNLILDRDFDVRQLTTFDMDFVFINARAEAVGKDVKVDFICNNTPDGSNTKCGGTFTFDLNLKNVKSTGIIKTEFDEVSLSPTVAVKFKYPMFDATKNIPIDNNAFDRTSKMIVAVTDYIAVSERGKGAEPKMIFLSEMDEEYVKEFIDSLTMTQFKVFEDFIDTIPSYIIDTKTKCPNCGFEHEGHFENLTSFF